MIIFSELKELELSKQLTVDIDLSKVPMFEIPKLDPRFDVPVFSPYNKYVDVGAFFAEVSSYCTVCKCDKCDDCVHSLKGLVSNAKADKKKR